MPRTADERLQEEARGHARSVQVEWDSAAADFDALFLFPPENSTAPTASPRELASSSQPSSVAHAIPRLGTVSGPVEPTNAEAQALHDDSSQLRDGSAHLSAEYGRDGSGRRETAEHDEQTADTVGGTEKRRNPLDIVLDPANTTDDRLAALNQLAEDARLRASILEAQKQRIDHGLVEAKRVANLLTTMEARLANLAEKGQRLRSSQQTFDDLDHRAGDTTAGREGFADDFEVRKDSMEQSLSELQRRADDTIADLERRLGDFAAQQQVVERAWAEVEQRARVATRILEQRLAEVDAQKEAIERTLTEASRVTAVLSGLETRVVNLTETGQLVDRAAPAPLQAQLESLTETPQNDLERLADYRLWTVRKSWPPFSRSSAKGASPRTTWRELQQWLHSLPLREALVASLAIASLVVTVLLGVMATRSVFRWAGPRDSALEATQRESGQAGSAPFSASVETSQDGSTPVVVASAGEARPAASSPFLVSRSLPSSPVTVAVSTPSLQEAVVRDSRPVPEPIRPAVVRAAAVQPVPSRRAAPPPKATSNETVDTEPFIGVLAIRSEPAGATVFVNQKPVGETPVRLTALRAGSHIVRIERDGYERWTTAVLVPANKQAVVDAKLQVDRAR